MRSASSTAWPAISPDSPTWRLISSIEDESSSAADATVCTLADACSAAATTVTVWRLVSSAVADMERAVTSMPEAALASACASKSAFASKLLDRASRRSSRASLAMRATSCAALRSRASIILSLKTCSARASVPISSRRHAEVTLTSRSPLASVSMDRDIAPSGRVMLRTIM